MECHDEAFFFREKKKKKPQHYQCPPIPMGIEEHIDTFTTSTVSIGRFKIFAFSSANDRLLLSHIKDKSKYENNY